MLGLVPKFKFLQFLREKHYKKQTKYSENVTKTNTRSKRIWIFVQFKRPTNFTEADGSNFGSSLEQILK